MMEAIYNFLPAPLDILVLMAIVVGISIGVIFLIAILISLWGEWHDEKLKREGRELELIRPNVPDFAKNPHLLPIEDQIALFNRGYPGFYPDYSQLKKDREQDADKVGLKEESDSTTAESKRTAESEKTSESKRTPLADAFFKFD